jgi:hypothetical protein
LPEEINVSTKPETLQTPELLDEMRTGKPSDEVAESGYGD